MKEDDLLSPQDLQKKFQKWFKDPIPPDQPFPTETDHSFGNHDQAELLSPAEAEHLIESSILTSLPFSVETNQSYNNTSEKHVDDLQKLVELFSFGFRGAVFLGAVVGIIFLMMDVNYWGWYSDDWPSQIIVILFAVVIGFFIGLFMGPIYKLRERYNYKDEY